ncbi:ORF6N domain-containing protein [Salmonella enterica subsp. enterica serovar Bonariensis]|nr:ORF6N domain-containing protein [Salmonella enterica subsp. enterica serovar Bonariensis]EHL9624011.1 ORF6N domain-containing protein [Salmonella enterica subsp. enterica serovar Bonariensis]
MTTQIPVESLSVVSHSNVPVITTELLASLYATNTDNIKKNYSRNQERFVLGKHFFKLEGTELKEFKDRVTLSHSVAKHTRSLILWTERGAARHAKMLETDQAWEVFEKLEDHYFNQAKTSQMVPAVDLMNFDIFQAIRNGKVAFVKHHRAGELMTAEEALCLLKARGWLVMPREELAGRLMEL